MHGQPPIIFDCQYCNYGYIYYDYIAAEKPAYSISKQREMFTAKKPENCPQDAKKKRELSVFCKQVKIILTTVHDNEFEAAVTFMEPPSNNFKKAVMFPNPNMYVGKFVGIETALIQSKPVRGVTRLVRDAIKAYPSAKLVIGVGLCYAFDREKYNFADVVVSETIRDFQTFKLNAKGEVENRGQAVDVVHELKEIFCFSKGMDFEVSDNRNSKARPGAFCCTSILMNKKTERDKFFHAAKSVAIGGEMEGRELIEFEHERQIKGVIVIKGVANYDDGKKDETWQFTAAMAALNYTKMQLLNVDLSSFFFGE